MGLRHHLHEDMCSPSRTPQQKATCPKPVAHWPLPLALFVTGTGPVRDGLLPFYPLSISVCIFPEVQLPEQELAAAGKKTADPGIKAPAPLCPFQVVCSLIALPGATASLQPPPFGSLVRG